MSVYEPQKIEQKWQQYWDDRQTFAADTSSKKKKFFCLVEFPYPSGEGLHVGHPRSYTAMDIMARTRRMQGYNVLYPIGFDSFGLPAENYAIKTGTHPAITTKKNIETFSRQLKSLGFSFDWDRAVSTADPEYYKWTQWIFLKMLKAGLAYRSKMTINWCPKDKIGLANEEVINGNCERCGTQVEKREKEQWMFRITKYADRLIEDLQKVDYLDRIAIQQENWIGRSEGAHVTFALPGFDHSLEVFTTRPDTLFGVTYMVIAPEHELIQSLLEKVENKDEVLAYIDAANKKSDLERTELQKEKTGVELKGVTALNPASGEKIPVWISDYVLASYGTGAIMAVPAHDERDWQFAKKFNIPMTQVVEGGDITEAAHTDIDNSVLINSGEFNGELARNAIGLVTAWLEDRNLGRKAVSYKLRDWVFSRQRYWGEPIPIVYCEHCYTESTDAVEGVDYSTIDGKKYAIVSVPDEQLPITLPEVEHYEPTDSGESPLASVEEWVNVPCPTCGGAAKRETDTMPNWAGSNWYFLRYTDPHNDEALASDKALEYWMPVDWYNGGMEHTTLHLLYSRFIYKVLHDIGVIPKQCGPEPYAKRTSHGMILGNGGEKMSKSRGNVVNPDDVVAEYGADTFRMYEMFMGPFDQAIPWDTNGVKGVRRFLEKVWDGFIGGKITLVKNEDSEVTRITHDAVKKITEGIETQSYNTCVSTLMIVVNTFVKHGSITKQSAEMFARLLAPFAPHIAEELWHFFGHKGAVAHAAWPKYDESVLETQEVTIVVQVNSKVRDQLVIDKDAMQQVVAEKAQEQEKIKKYLEGVEIVNVIYVPGRLINFVTR